MRSWIRALFVVASVAASLQLVHARLGCLDEQGNAVDWFAAIKRNDTFAYLYMGPSSSDFVSSKYTLADGNNGAISHTLAQLYGSSTASYLIYNDEPPSSSASSSYAHAKGVVGASDALDGFWLIHSTPRFPFGPEESPQYSGMPEDEHIYGQSFLCISISGSEALRTVGAALLLDHPKVYSSNVSEAVAAAAPDLASVAADKHSDAASCEATKLVSAGGAAFTVFAKSSYWASELYADCVAPHIGAPRLLVESWIRGSACEPVCGAEQVLDVGGVEFGGYPWRETQDHSKWAVTDSGSTGCIGDINRMTSQAKRGGGTVCTSAGALGAALRRSVTSFRDACVAPAA